MGSGRVSGEDFDPFWLYLTLNGYGAGIAAASSTGAVWRRKEHGEKQRDRVLGLDHTAPEAGIAPGLPSYGNC